MLSQDEFLEKYGLKSGDIVDYEEDVKDLDYHFVWTLVDAEGESYLYPGFHLVNRLGYVVSDKPWTDEEDEEGLEVLWDEPEDEDDNPEEDEEDNRQ
jgi:hypothetical protein